MTIKELEDILDKKMYPIIHPERDLKDCILCCPTDKNYLSQCTHYLILTDYSDNKFTTRLITKSSNYDNIPVCSDQFSITTLTYFFGEKIKYYSLNTFIMPYNCIRLISYKGYFKYI